MSISKAIAGLAAMGALLAPSVAGAQTPELEWADRLIADLPTPSQNNDYGSPAVISWAGVDGASVSYNRSKCAPFVTRMIKQGRGWSDDDFRSWFGTSGPDSAQYYDRITAGGAPFSSSVTNIAGVRPGDVIAFRYDANGTSGSGHTMLAAGAPVEIAPVRPFVPGTTQYTVEVADSTSSPHGNDDSRRYLVGTSWKEQDGAGKGKIRLYTDALGQIVGHTWSLKSTSYYPNVAGSRPIAIGRI